MKLPFWDQIFIVIEFFDDNSMKTDNSMKIDNLMTIQDFVEKSPLWWKFIIVVN